MVEFGLLLGATPDQLLPLSMYGPSDSSGLLLAHVGENGHQAVDDMLEGVYVIVEEDDLVVGIGLPYGAADRFEGGCHSGWGEVQPTA